MRADKTGWIPRFSAQTGEPDSSDKAKSEATEWGHAWLRSWGEGTRYPNTNAQKPHVTLQQSAKSSCVCVCWQRQTEMLLPAAQPPEGSRQTLTPLPFLFIATRQDTKKTLSTTNPPAGASKSWKWV